jgi:UDP:flavonoid glycosyltransferase YjiC (YdhE family)
MSTFLLASIPVQAHATNPLPIAARLVERGHTVLWYTGRAFHDRVRAIGAIPLAYVRAADFSGHDLFEYFPQFAGRGGPRVIGEAFAQVFVGHAPERVDDLREIISEHPVDAMLCDGLMYGVGMVSELTGVPYATFGDGPMPYWDADTPPFGPGLLPVRGPVGRLRNRLVRAVAERVIFREAQRRYDAVRAELGLPPDRRSVLEVVASPMLHLQGCTPAFEYPIGGLPPEARWIGALRPDPVRSWQPPAWWSQLDRPDRPVVHVTQGSLRTDPTELIVPTIRALAGSEVLVVITSGGATADEIARAYGGPLPGNVRVESFLPYDELLARADVFVTNGGYTGVTLAALAHGVPIVQAGTTEEKSEIGARIQWTGVGLRLGTTRPSPRAVGKAVDRVLREAGFRVAARRVQAEMAAHDAGREGADLLEQLAAAGRVAGPARQHS